jgi:ribonuclease BN (tRNA processing enzyme)
VLYDSNYTDLEYPTHEGWGHSTWQEAVKLADAACVGKLLLFHHDPSHGDEFLDAVAKAAADRRPGTELAQERTELVW